jgi:hypothetical protein
LAPLSVSAGDDGDDEGGEQQIILSWFLWPKVTWGREGEKSIIKLVQESSLIWVAKAILVEEELVQIRVIRMEYSHLSRWSENEDLCYKKIDFFGC